MNPLGTRARVEELARLLDGAVAGPGALTAGHAVLATRLRALAPALEPRLAPRPEFRAALRQRLVAVATVQAGALQTAQAAPAPYAGPLARPKALDAAVSWSQSRRGQRRLGVTAGAMAGVVALTGMGIAASRSLPGEPFYGLKRGTEGLQLDLAHGDTAKGTKHLEFAATRLREVRALARGEGELSLGGGTTPLAGGGGRTLQRRVDATLADFDAETTAGSRLLQRAFRVTGKQAPLRILTSFSTQQQVRLASIIPDLPAGSRAVAQQSLALVTEVGSTADQLLSLGTCGASCAPSAGGPTVPSEPEPTPGTTAVPSGSPDDNGVPPCVCLAPTPGQTAGPSPSSGEPTDAPGAPGEQPTPQPTPTPTPSSTPAPGPTLPVVLPTAVTTLLPTPISTLLTTPLPLPVPLPTLPPLLPTTQPSVLPSLLSLLPTLAPQP